MKNLLFAFFLLLAGFGAGAQETIRYKENFDPSIKRQADSLRELYFKAGFILMKENSVNMESQYEFPVIVPLKAGEPYHFVFIGDMSSKLYEVRMYDWSEKQVFYKKHMWGDMDGNIIQYPYTSGQDEYHMIKVLQVNKAKKKDLPGYVMFFRRTHSQEELEAQAKKYGMAMPETHAVAQVAEDPKLPEPVKNDSTPKKKNNYDQYLEKKN
ncbi:hypothetical protein EPD60_13400 [Flaviaesturariibacter flavus]|uniref:DUF4251 domain-containing protein n=1 Tax=Flaviaesturariibacter flavus TaxID=2502780 RepID=A0A4R1B8J1_9BACT|nr:hypothetical protein [Flaviaesturariibacter flavus]TCJ13378.1 hypothetical protein EPD60_13400 [Flaviaesturariibacter flavus]